MWHNSHPTVWFISDPTRYDSLSIIKMFPNGSDVSRIILYFIFKIICRNFYIFTTILFFFKFLQRKFLRILRKNQMDFLKYFFRWSRWRGWSFTWRRFWWRWRRWYGFPPIIYLFWYPTNIVDSLCMSWYTGDTTGSDDSKKSENNSEKNSRLAMSNRSGSDLSRSHNSTVGCATGSQIGN